MAININSTVLSNGLIGYYDVLNIKSIGPNFNNNLRWKDLLSLSDNSTDLVGSVSFGATAPQLSFTRGDNTIIKSIETTSTSSLASYLKTSYTTNKTIRTISFWIKKNNTAGTEGSNPYFFDSNSNIADTYINSNGYGPGLDGTDSYYNGIWIGNNDFFAQELLFSGPLVNTWKNVTLVFPIPLTISYWTLFANVNGTNTTGMSYNVAQVLAFNTALSIDDIATNYFAFKGRYGI